MFGKLSTIVSYMKIWDVYIIKRFPSNKLSIWGMLLSYSMIAWFLNKCLINHRTRSLQKLRQMNKSEWVKCPITRFWSFNPAYINKQTCAKC